MDVALRQALDAQLGATVQDASRVGGGDINRAWRVRLGDGRTLFVKSHDAPPARMFACEARGLAWLREAGALRVPEVRAVSDGGGEAPAFLALEWIEARAPARDADEAFGRGLAMLHRHGAPSFGLDHDNFIALLPQANAPADDWASFYAERRLAPQLRMATDRGRATRDMRFGLERLFARMRELCGPPAPPARLHGDLWSGNLIHDEHGAPCLVDPAVYGGHREIDLAMMRLFGGFSPRVFAAYAEAHPLSPGHEERIALYQLYPLLVHVNLFGGSYATQVERVLTRCG